MDGKRVIEREGGRIEVRGKSVTEENLQLRSEEEKLIVGIKVFLREDRAAGAAVADRLLALSIALSSLYLNLS